MPDLRHIVPADRPTRLLAAATLVNTFGNGLFFTVSVVYFTRIVGLSAHQLGWGSQPRASRASSPASLPVTWPTGWAPVR